MFDIEPVTLIVSTLFMCTFCAPFIYYSQKNKKKNKLLISKLHEQANSAGANLSEVETWRFRYGIGFDSKKKVLVYLQDGQDLSLKSFNLNEYRKVNLIKKYSDEKQANQNYRIPESVVLELVPRLESSDLHQLEFYHADHFTDLQGETVLADKWYQTLKNQVHS
ncbi:hypothetical protein [Algoriphagus pacificus]|uniref:Uncharacterized protein n=1 Tax=Algoriphagus pacificus TaxID=2811234 RepID=A0ABS3CKE8_9BACT|nr:hypothetical protein [Algoriphagus pacificus]MBN7817004.1 hypothetical protein [Algoriphagus pacificus]